MVTGEGNKSTGAFLSTKISENSGSKSNGTENFWKLISKILVSLSRLSFFLEMWKYRKFPVPFDISTWYESAPVSLVVP